MRLRLTISGSTGVAYQSGPDDRAGPNGDHDLTDVEVSAPAGEPLASVLGQFQTMTCSDGPAYVADSRLPEDAQLGRPPLTEGALVTIGGPGPADGPAAGLLALHVVAGPDAGGVHALRPGTLRLGRGPSAQLQVVDPELSRDHATLAVTARGVWVSDRRSTNGTSIDGQRVDGDPVRLPPGALLRAGESTLVLDRPEDPPAAVQPDGRGQLAVNRPPRLLPPPPEVSVRLPTAPATRDNPRFPVLTTMIPLAIGAMMVPVMHSWTFALFMLLSPVMLGANAVSDRIGGRRVHRRAQADYQQAERAAQAEVTAGLAAEAALRRCTHPDAATLLLTATGPRRRLWERGCADPDALTLRLGTADLPARLTLCSDGVDVGAAGAQQPAVVTAVPLTVSLRDVGVLGLAGQRDRVMGLARHAIAQLAALHSPRELDLVVLCAPAGQASQEWRWVRWLPHLRPVTGQPCQLLVGLSDEQIAARVAELLTSLDARTAAAEGAGAVAWSGPSTVLVLDGARTLRSVGGIARLLDEGPRAGIYALCLTEDALALPAECGATAVVTGVVGTRLLVRRTGRPPVPDVVADLVSPVWAERFARALAPLRDATPDGGQSALPASVRLLDLFDLPDRRVGARPMAEQIAARWKRGGHSTEALLGMSASGPVTVDLCRDGPHALVAGTTGAGKSELLQTLVASLAVNNRPDDMAFVLVDYKGGAAFAECARLPHAVGMVTDLDGHLTQRALISLNAELKRRERALHAAGCKDLADLGTVGVLGSTGCPAGSLPRLVIIIDEFASLAQELPDFVTGLVDIARRGRSLGVHLVLATQRPAGVVSGEIRANTNLRIALRMTDPTESQDVIDSSGAALISRGTPGRAYCRTGSGDLVAFQCARVSGSRPPDPDVSREVRPMTWETAGDAPAHRQVHTDEAGPTDLAALVCAVGEAAHSLGIAPVRSPWLPPLPDVVALSDLPCESPGLLPLGLCDVPAEQSRVPFTFDLAGDGHLLAAGGPGSGRTTLLRTVAGTIAGGVETQDVHLYVFDCAGGGLSALADLPHCGAVVGREETDRGDRLLSRLTAEITRRQQILARAGYGSAAEQRTASDAPDRLPWLVLAVDGWEGFVVAYEDVDSGRPIDRMLGLFRDGAAVGLRAVVAGDRSTLTGRLSSLMKSRLILRMPDPMDYALAGLSTRQVPQTLRPGQALIPGDPPLEVQLALLCADPAGPAQAAELGRLTRVAAQRAANMPPQRRPVRVESLPESVSYPQVAAAVGGAHGPLWTVIGAGGDDVTPIGTDLAEDGPAFLVSGPPRSGRSTALLTMARWYTEHATAIMVVTPRRSPLRDLPGVLRRYTPHEASEMADDLAGIAGPLVVFADDAGELLDTAMEAVLCDMLHSAAERPVALVLSGTTDDLITTYRGITAEARRHKVGLVLSPSGPVDGDVLGVRLPRGLAPRVGRGVLAVRGVATPLQVAC